MNSFSLSPNVLPDPVCGNLIIEVVESDDEPLDSSIVSQISNDVIRIYDDEISHD